MAAGGDRKLEREKKNIEGILDRTSFIPISSPHLPLPIPFSLFRNLSKVSVRWRSEEIEKYRYNVLRVGWKIARWWKGCYYTSFNNDREHFNMAVASFSPWIYWRCITKGKFEKEKCRFQHAEYREWDEFSFSWSNDSNIEIIKNYSNSCFYCKIAQ